MGSGNTGKAAKLGKTAVDAARRRHKQQRSAASTQVPWAAGKALAKAGTTINAELKRLLQLHHDPVERLCAGAAQGGNWYSAGHVLNDANVDPFMRAAFGNGANDVEGADAGDDDDEDDAVNGSAHSASNSGQHNAVSYEEGDGTLRKPITLPLPPQAGAAAHGCVPCLWAAAVVAAWFKLCAATHSWSRLWLSEAAAPPPLPLPQDVLHELAAPPPPPAKLRLAATVAGLRGLPTSSLSLTPLLEALCGGGHGGGAVAQGGGARGGGVLSALGMRERGATADSAGGGSPRTLFDWQAPLRRRTDLRGGHAELGADGGSYREQLPMGTSNTGDLDASKVKADLQQLPQGTQRTQALARFRSQRHMHSIGMAFLNEPMYSTTASFDGLSWQLAVKSAIGVEEQTAGCKLCGKSPGGTLHARLCQAPRVKAHDTIVHNSVKRATQRILRQYIKTGLVDEDYTPFLGSAGPPGSRRMDIVLPADAFPVTGYDDPTRHLPLIVDVTCFEAQVASRAAKTAADPERCCRDQEAAKTTNYSGHYDQNCYKLATLAIGSFGSIGEQGRKLLEAVATEYASRMSVPGGARPKALKGIALARLRSALSAALHMAYSGRVMTHMAESRGGGHMEEDAGEDPEMPFGGGGV
ncbi:hypothetical protein JKP88DRAFT_275490 [Tribonema minus]|uniref:Uncharacterized protein n=1 Tax=Tribonema minus TaxID=303371 RepID=A0A836CK17_9STRA|nr:hypothetical protein JKP88DRAFT_275490 [Tribonema minus]